MSQPTMAATSIAAMNGTRKSRIGRFDVVMPTPRLTPARSSMVPTSAWIRRRMAMATPMVATPTTMAVSIMAWGSGLCSTWSRTRWAAAAPDPEADGDEEEDHDVWNM
jgi:hypothetical protein